MPEAWGPFVFSDWRVRSCIPLYRLLFRLVWPLTWPIRTYWVRSERKLGKRFVMERVVRPLLPAPPAGFETERPGGGRVFVHYREDLGLVTLMSGGFEVPETEQLVALARPGSAAVDVGANVGMFTVPLAHAVGARGVVFAFEPFPANVERLRENLRRNGLANVEVHELAVGERNGEIELVLGDDSMYHSTVEVAEGRGTGDRLAVPLTTLDRAWKAAGRPDVSVLKVDIEGGEDAVLRGASELLETCRPSILVEAATAERYRALAALLEPYGYTGSSPRGFSASNFLFSAGRPGPPSRPI